MSGEQAGPWSREINSLSRALSGAAIFGIPLLYSENTWQVGTLAGVGKLTVFLALTFVFSVYLTRVAGFQSPRPSRPSVDQALEAVALAVLGSLTLSFVLGQIAPGESLDNSLGKVIIQAIPLAIGASFANAVVPPRGKSRAGASGEEANRHPWKVTLKDLGATLAGGMFIGLTVAATNAVPIIAASLDYERVFLLVAISLAVSYVIVYESGFNPDRRPERGQGLFTHPLGETVAAYVVSLVLALALLYLFDQITIGSPIDFIVLQAFVLALPTSVGGAAGRLVL